MNPILSHPVEPGILRGRATWLPISLAIVRESSRVESRFLDIPSSPPLSIASRSLSGFHFHTLKLDRSSHFARDSGNPRHPESRARDLRFAIPSTHMQTSSVKVSPFELMSAILNGKSTMLSDSGVAIILENRELLMILTTAVAVVIGCLFVFIWRRSNGQKSSKGAEAPKPVILEHQQSEPEVDDGKKKVAIFFGTQTGTAEGFAKALAEEARARYDKATFKVIDLDDYGADDDEYEEKIKKETIALFFLATYGDGEPTDNAARFYKWFAEGKEDRGNWLQNLQFGVFGLGNRQYEHFNKIAKVVDELLAEQVILVNDWIVNMVVIP
ncbi:MFS transporter multidrug-resistance type transporter [Asimina triloba]